MAGDKEGGFVVVAGDAEKVKEISGKVKEELPGLKGGGKAGRFQGKTSCFLPKDIEFLRGLVEG